MKTIPTDQVVARLRNENPWWEPPHRVSQSVSDWSPRPYLALFYPLATDRKVRRAVVLLGPRRVGKTVLLHHTIQNLLAAGVSPHRICYVSVDHPLYNGLSVEDFVRAFSTATGVDPSKEETFLLLDEIQYLRQWELHLKALVDGFPALKCIASGSAAAALRLKSAESGAGRFTDFLLPPLTFHEYMELLGLTDLVRIEEVPSGGVKTFDTSDITALNGHFLNYLNFGGYPEVAFSEEIRRDPSRFIKGDIIDKVLLRDLPSLYGIQDVQELNYLFTTLAFNTANEVSLEQLSKGSGVAKNTIKRYVEYLEAAFLVRAVHRVDRNARRFERANFFKVYLTNPSMRAALFSPVKMEDEPMGPLVETAIFSQWFHSGTPLHYARWPNGEVDIVSLGPNQKAAWAIEVKWSDRYIEHPQELSSLLKFAHAQNLTHAVVTSRTTRATRTLESVTFEFLPASLFCYRLGYNLLHAKYKQEGLMEEQVKVFEKVKTEFQSERRGPRP